jgi:hypothetical protein
VGDGLLEQITEDLAAGGREGGGLDERLDVGVAADGLRDDAPP